MVQKELLSIQKRGEDLRRAGKFDHPFNLSLELLGQAQNAMSVASLNADSSGDKDCLWVETLSSCSPEEDPFHQCHTKDLAKRKSEAVAKISEILPPREMIIIKARFGLDGEPPVKLVDLARTLGISSTWVDQLQKSAMKKLRLAFEDEQDLLLSN
jgi:DNA-directed RNA polymerase sigma subunit (sigma70/sigma32)